MEREKRWFSSRVKVVVTRGSVMRKAGDVKWWRAVIHHIFEVPPEDGTRLAAVATSDQIYLSTDSGATWTAYESSRPWKSVAMSADGKQVLAADEYGYLYTVALPTTAATRIEGPLGSSVRLLYTGADQFLVADGFGSLFAY